MSIKSLLVVVTGILLAGCASADVESRVVQDAAAAIGGADRIMAVETLVLQGTGENFNLGQNPSPDAELPRFEVTEYRKAIDLANRRWRQELIRVARFAAPNPAPQTQIVAVDDGIAFNVGGGGAEVRQGDQVARDRHAELYHHPVAILQAALQPGAQVMGFRSVNGREDSVDIRLDDGLELTLFVDAATRLPTRVQSLGYHGVLGDVVVETIFGDYASVDGLELPGSLTTRLDRYTISSLQVSSQVNGDAGDLRASDEVRAASVPAPAVVVEVEQVGPGLWYLRGGSHHSIVYEFDDHLTLIEAPQNDSRTLAVIERARELNPDKPLTQVINTHHHFDHSGGVRAAISEGLTVITHQGNVAFFEELASRRHGLNPDALERNPQPLQIEGVSERHVITDGTRSMELYPIVGNEHSETMLMVYLPAERIVVQGDLFTPAAPNAPNPRFPSVVDMLDNIRNYNLNVERFMPIHGPGIATMAQARAAAETETRAAAAQQGVGGN